MQESSKTIITPICSKFPSFADDSPSEVPCPPLSWPLLLKPLRGETCTDPEQQTTHPVQVVNITELLADAEGTLAALYVTSAKLADLDTFQRLADFDMEEFCSKSDFLEALAEHLDLQLQVTQRSSLPITITTVCRRDLLEALPDTTRGKRHTDQMPLKTSDIDAQQKLEEAMRIATRLYQ